MAQFEQRMSEESYHAVARQLDALVQAFEALPFPEVRNMAFDMLQAVDALHREALQRLLALLQEQGQQHVIEQAMHDPIVHMLLQLYDLAPHGSSSAGRLPASAVSFNGIPVTNDAPATTPGPYIPLTLVQREPAPAPSRQRRPRFAPVAQLTDLSTGTMRAFDVAGMRVLLANIDGEVYAVRNTCPGSMAPLELGSFTPPVVICPWHNEAFDVRTGKRVDGSPIGATGRDLVVLPVAVKNNLIQLAIDTATGEPDEAAS